MIDEDQQQLHRKNSNGDEIDCTTKLTCTVTTNEGFRRKKSASLNSPANSGKTRRDLVGNQEFRIYFCRKSSNS